MYTTLENAPQGSAAWHAARAQHFCASEAAAAMGLSKYTSRDQLLRQKATGLTEEVNPAKQRLFDAGHEAEALARPIAEGIAGTEFYPVVATREVDGLPLLASFDGIDLMDEVIWENKLLNQKLVQQVQAGDLDPHYYLQLEHQLLVSGAARALFTTSDGTPEGTHSLWYESKPERRAQLIAGWKQFQQDLAAYQAPAPKAAAVVADAMESLPAVSLRLDGKLAVISNLPDFTTALRAFIKRIPAKPETDQDFANAESACKALKRTEDALTAGEDAALGEMVDFEAMRRQVRDLKDLARTTRLATEKLVAARKEQIRGEIVASGVARYQAHIESLNASLGRNYMPRLPVDFGGAVKGKRTVESLRGAVNDELARAKIAAGEVAQNIQTNLNLLREKAGAHAFLFADTATIVLKQPDDLSMLVKARIAEHDAAEVKRLEAEREKIREEEQAKAQREAEAKEAQRKKDEEYLAGAEQREQARQAEIAWAVLATRSARDEIPTTPEGLRGGYQRLWVAPEAGVQGVVSAHKCDGNHGGPMCADHECWNGGEPQDTGERVNLTAINERFAPIQLTSVGLAQLGFEPVATVKASKLYRACDLSAMAAALISHLHALEAVPA